MTNIIVCKQTRAIEIERSGGRTRLERKRERNIRQCRRFACSSFSLGVYLPLRASSRSTNDLASDSTSRAIVSSEKEKKDRKRRNTLLPHIIQ